jgi:hypothetical protein
VSRIELRRPRDVASLFRDSGAVYLRHLWLFIPLAAAVVVPVHLVVQGIGLEMLTSSYDESLDAAELLVPSAVEFLVVLPIVTAIGVYALEAIARAERPRAREVLVAGFEAFTPLFAAVVLAGLGIVVGLLALVVPGVFLAVRWFLVPQAVVIDGARGAGALRRSGDLVQGFWWRTFGLVVLANVAVVIPGVILLEPFTAIAESTDDSAWELVGGIVTTSVTSPFLALFSTFLYYDLLARGAHAPH